MYRYEYKTIDGERFRKLVYVADKPAEQPALVSSAQITIETAPITISNISVAEIKATNKRKKSK